MNDEVLLRPGIQIGTALEALRTLITRANNVAGGTGLGQLLNDYLTWVEDAETQLRSLFASDALWRELFSDRYWHLRELAVGRPIRPVPLIVNEARWQAARLDALAQQLVGTQQLFELPTDCMAIVPDANVFAHYRRYNEIDWPKLVAAPSARLIVPLLVIDQLDELSYKSREGGKRAFEVLRAIQHLRGIAPPEAPIDVRPGVALQLMVDPARHKRRANSDDEFLARVEYLASLVDRVVVATGDYGMRLRAQGRGLRWIDLPQELRL